MTTARRRLDPEQRRGQLLDIGARLFAERPYEDVWIEEVAELAGVSRGLMYQQVSAGLDSYIAYFTKNPHGVLAVHQGSLSGDQTIKEIIDWELGVLQQRMLDALALDGHLREVGTAAVRGWLAFTKAVCIDQLQHATMTAEEMRELCLRTLVGALGSSAHLEERPR